MSKHIRGIVHILTAWMLGIRDGWSQPYDLSTSHNVDHLDDGDSTTRYSSGIDVYYAQDTGINLGQILRAGRSSQAWREGWRHVTPWDLS